MTLLIDICEYQAWKINRIGDKINLILKQRQKLCNTITKKNY